MQALQKRPPFRLDLFTWLAALGSGAYATVHRFRRDDGCIVAMKIVTAAPRTAEAEQEQRQIRALQMLDDEHTLLRELSHDQIVKVESLIPKHDTDGQIKALCLEMEFCSGGSLFDVIYSTTPPTESQTMRIGIHVSSALEYCHGLGIVHRDVKPENILLHDGDAKLGDFGLATKLPSEGYLTRPAGTDGYKAPEEYCQGWK